MLGGLATCPVVANFLQCISYMP